MNKYIEIFKHFLMLGVISFGGPAAHIGYFHQKFVHQLKWLSQEKYGQIVALSQFLPGPGSSQVGFAVGYQKAGLLGAITAFIAFTLPLAGAVNITPSVFLSMNNSSPHLTLSPTRTFIEGFIPR